MTNSHSIKITMSSPEEIGGQYRNNAEHRRLLKKSLHSILVNQNALSRNMSLVKY